MVTDLPSKLKVFWRFWKFSEFSLCLCKSASYCIVSFFDENDFLAIKGISFHDGNEFHIWRWLRNRSKTDLNLLYRIYFLVFKWCKVCVSITFNVFLNLHFESEVHWTTHFYCILNFDFMTVWQIKNLNFKSLDEIY